MTQKRKDEDQRSSPPIAEDAATRVAGAAVSRVDPNIVGDESEEASGDQTVVDSVGVGLGVSPFEKLGNALDEVDNGKDTTSHAGIGVSELPTAAKGRHGADIGSILGAAEAESAAAGPAGKYDKGMISSGSESGGGEDPGSLWDEIVQLETKLGWDGETSSNDRAEAGNVWDDITELEADLGWDGKTFGSDPEGAEPSPAPEGDGVVDGESDPPEEPPPDNDGEGENVDPTGESDPPEEPPSDGDGEGENVDPTGESDPPQEPPPDGDGEGENVDASGEGDAGGGVGSSLPDDYVDPNMPDLLGFDDSIAKMKEARQRGASGGDDGSGDGRGVEGVELGSGGPVPDVKDRLLGGDNVEPVVGGHGGREIGSAPGGPDPNEINPSPDAEGNPTGSGPYERESRHGQLEMDEVSSEDDPPPEPDPVIEVLDTAKQLEVDDGPDALDDVEPLMLE